MVTVSIITVVYNNEFIGSAIQSVISQDYPFIEYIVIDGGSTDKTLEIISTFPHKVHKFVSEPDKGIYDAINKGIKLASGDVIGILNADDFFVDSSVISRIASYFNANLEIEGVYADILFTEQHDITKITRRYASNRFRPWMFRFGFQPAHPSFYARKELFDRYGLYAPDYKIAGDFDLLLRFLYIHKVRAIYVKDVWVKMRMGGVSTAGVKSLVRLNSEILKSCKSNLVYTNMVMIYSKYLFKWWGFFFARF
jgi:glycosyltransferase involved in cell wall biosynthesis